MPKFRPKTLVEPDLSRLIEMAWEDRTPFEAIEKNFGFKEPKVIAIMRSALKRRSFDLWRARVSGRITKQGTLRNPDVKRAYCQTQYRYK